MYINDTIAAISTPHGTGGIGIIRISGDNAFEICSKLFKGKKPFNEIKTHTINYGKIVEPTTGDMVDEVLVSKMKGPNTFTREDIVEINCHGGTVVLLKILELVVACGARPAEPGEFTKRAFLNGRLDLSQAEAVIDLINAKTNEGSRAAVSQLEGRLSERIKKARSKLIELIAHIEVTVDYPEHDIEEITGRQVYDDSKVILDTLNEIASSFNKGRILREGIKAVIVGKPNVGKSSLLNELAGKSKAIVTDIPGTTRDIIEEYVSIKGIPVNLSDTAGIRETADPIERIGVEKARNAIEEADLVIMMLDGLRKPDEEDKAIISQVSGKKIIYIINKIDKADQEAVSQIEEQILRHGDGSSVTTLFHVKQQDRDGDGSAVLDNGQDQSDIHNNDSSSIRIVKASMLRGEGLDKLEEAIAGLFIKGDVAINNEILVTNIRHKNLLDMAAASIKEACKAYETGMPLDMITIDIKNAAEYLGQITGESVSEDVVHEIFSRFCIGK